MDARQNGGCFTPIRIIAGAIASVIFFIAAIAEITGAWDIGQFIESGFKGIFAVFSAAFIWLIQPFSLPRFLFIILVLFTLPVILWVFRYIQKLFFPGAETKRVLFRELWLFVKVEPRSKIPRVQNIKCGLCMGRIVSGDNEQSSYTPIRYLKCENGHYVGSDISYEDYQRDLEKQIKVAEQQQIAQNAQYQEERENLAQRLREGEITQQEYERFEQDAPARRLSGYYLMLDPSQLYTIEDFYNQIIRDFELKYEKQHDESIPLLNGADQ